MKYAFMSFSCRQAGLDKMLAIARRFGYDAIEPRINEGHSHGIETDLGAAERANIKQRSARAGVPIGCIACSACFGNKNDAGTQVEDTLLAVDLAADTGSSRVRVFADVPDGSDVGAAIEVAAESLGKVADHAQERGVVVCIETHSGFADPVRMAKLMERTNHAAIAVNWDVLHPLRLAGASVDHTFETLKPWIRYIHIHDGVNAPGKSQIKAIGTGDVDHQRVLELCNSISYDGYLSLEWEAAEPWEIHLPREIAAMKRYEAGLS